MALTTCKNCGEIVSDRAEYCPHCHFQIENKNCVNNASQNSENDNNTTTNPYTNESNKKKSYIVHVLIAIFCVIVLIVAYNVYMKNSVDTISLAAEMRDKTSVEHHEENAKNTESLSTIDSCSNVTFNKDEVIKVAKEFISSNGENDYAYLSDSFSRLLRKVNDLDDYYTEGVGWHDHNISTQSQEGIGKILGISAKQTSADKATVFIDTEWQDITYYMICEHDKWKVDDVTSSEMSCTEIQSLNAYLSELEKEISKRRSYLWVTGVYHFSAPGQFSNFDIRANETVEWTANDKEYSGTWDYCSNGGRYGKLILTFFNGTPRKFTITLITDNKQHLLANEEGFVLQKVHGQGKNIREVKTSTCSKCNGTGQMPIYGGNVIEGYQRCSFCGGSGKYTDIRGNLYVPPTR